MTTAVYQVTRPGHEHCDATEGILLDITPLVVDRRKFVTLYDKDLTEGVNLLIGMTGPIAYLPQLLLNKRKKWNPFLSLSLSYQFAVVSDLWGPQCVRLKVTVKSDNCGENADCSNKGICFSNASMVSRPETPFPFLSQLSFCWNKILWILEIHKKRLKEGTLSFVREKKSKSISANSSISLGRAAINGPPFKIERRRHTFDEY